MAPIKSSNLKGQATKKPQRIESDSDDELEEVADEKDLQIARLQEQVKLLTIEVETLRKHAAKRSPTTSPPPKTPSRKASRSTTETPSTPNSRRASTGPNKLKEKGCSCKGNCGTKLCGCVKKDIYCMPPFCKCSDQCKNQDSVGDNEDKENNSGNATVPEKDKSSSKQSLEVTKRIQKREKKDHLSASTDSHGEEFNPMKPRRQLPRSPPPGTSTIEGKTKLERPTVNASDLPLPSPKTEPDEEELLSSEGSDSF